MADKSAIAPPPNDAAPHKVSSWCGQARLLPRLRVPPVIEPQPAPAPAGQAGTQAAE